MIDGEKPFVWLASFPKSGNTWVRLFMAALRTGGLNINDLPRSCCYTDTIRYHYDSVSPRPLDEMDEYGILCLRWAVLQHLTCEGEKPMLVKTHSANVHSVCGPLIPPQLTAGVVHLVRDPRDVALSLAHHTGSEVKTAIWQMAHPTFMVGKFEGVASAPFHVVTDWSNHTASYLDEERFPVLTVRYEDMVADPRRSFLKILDFMGIEDRRYFRRALELTRFKALREQEGLRGFSDGKEDFFRAGKPGQWRNGLTEEEAAEIKAKHGEVMNRVDYQ